jgi:hypothetical protein
MNPRQRTARSVAPQSLHCDKLRSCEKAVLRPEKFSEGGFSGWLLSDLLSVICSEQRDLADSIDWIDSFLEV